MSGRRNGALAAGALLTAGAAAAALAQGGGLKLIVNGRIASMGVRMVDGRAYVPLADVAKAYNQTLVKRADGYELAATGGANQVEGLRGKVGDTLFDGKWRFTVLDIQPVDSYTGKANIHGDYAVYHELADVDSAARTVKAKAGKLYAVHCRVKNGQRTSEALYVYNPYTRTALTDDQEHSFPPVAYDMEGSNFSTPAILPGAARELTALFVVPEGAKLKDLVFTLRTLSGDQAAGSDARISLEK